MAKPVWTPVVASARSAGKNFSTSSFQVTDASKVLVPLYGSMLGCPAGRLEADEVVAAILGLGGPSYKYVLHILQIFSQVHC